MHVNDCTITASSTTLVANFKQKVSKHVEITDLGELHWLLGVKIKRDHEQCTIHLTQRSCIESILRQYNLQDLKPVSSPMEPHIRLTSSQLPQTTEEFAQMRDVPYHEAVGLLMYTALGTRPDIASAVQMVSWFSSKPGITHWEAVKQIFCYLKGTKDLWLTFGHEKTDLRGFTNTDGSMAEDC